MKTNTKSDTIPRNTKIRGNVVLGLRKKTAQVPIRRMRSLKAKLMSMPSQVTSHSRLSLRDSKTPSWGRTTIRMGLRKADTANTPLVTGPAYCWHRDDKDGSLLICHFERSSIVYSMSEVLVTAVVVSPQFSSWNIAKCYLNVMIGFNAEKKSTFHEHTFDEKIHPPNLPTTVQHAATFAKCKTFSE